MGFEKDHPKYGGRVKGTPNKVVPEIRLIAQSYGLEALMVAVRIMRNPKAEHMERLAASREVMNRAYGRAAETRDINLTGEIHIESLSDRQLFALLTRIDGAIEGARRERDESEAFDVIEPPDGLPQ